MTKRRVRATLTATDPFSVDRPTWNAPARRTAELVTFAPQA